AATATTAVNIPAGNGVVELVGRGPMTWVDPRIVSNLRVTRRALTFVLLGAVTIVIARRRARKRGLTPFLVTPLEKGVRPLFRQAAFSGMAAAIGMLVAA